MYRNTRFGAVLKALPKGVFDRLVETHRSDKHTKHFTTWDQFVSLVYAQLSGSRSLRELEAGYNGHAEHHYHLNCDPIRRSTLSDANRVRSPAVFESLLRYLLKGAHRHVRREMSDLLYLLDSSPVCLRQRGHEWTQGKSMSRVPGLKLHVLLAPAASLPCEVRITGSSVNDITEGRRIALERGAKYVFDKGYCDYGWWWKINESSAYFVTRLKNNAAVRVVESRAVSEPIVADEVVELSSARPGGKANPYTGRLRRIVVRRPDKDRDLVLISNLSNASAEEIAALYKRRWAIELFFKWIKQNLKIRQLLGRSENAVRTQLVVALITYLLAEQHRRLSGSTQAFYLWLAELKATLFRRTELEELVEKRRRRHQADPYCQQVAMAL